MGSSQDHDPTDCAVRVEGAPRSNLYASGWSPPGIRKGWERCSMGTQGAARVLGDWHEAGYGEMLEAVAWFDDPGNLKALVADYDNGRRIIVKVNARNWKITFGRVPERAPLRAAQTDDAVPGMTKEPGA